MILNKKIEKNIGYLFYKKLYANEDAESKLLNSCYESRETGSIKDSEIISEILKFQVEKKEIIKLGNESLKLKTTYPGLLLGSGYSHDTGLEGDFKLGFYFDYTTGLPIIPGSSIKGVLRSVFKHEDYIKELLGKEGLVIKELEQEIFDFGDTFYDAEIETEYKRIFGEDYLCPHDENPLKNPTPLKFLKVLPGITFRFQFKLEDGLITAKEKNELFRKILLDIGVGAKTNVGYGQFDRKVSDKLKEEADKKKQEEKQKKEEERRASLSQFEKDIEDLNKDILEQEITFIYNRLDDYNDNEQYQIAVLLKKRYIELNKWYMKMNKKSKQYKKVKRIKEILGEKEE